jgi:hypothetical protein
VKNYITNVGNCPLELHLEIGLEEKKFNHPGKRGGEREEERERERERGSGVGRRKREKEKNRERENARE